MREAEWKNRIQVCETGGAGGGGRGGTEMIVMRARMDGFKQKGKDSWDTQTERFKSTRNTSLQILSPESVFSSAVNKRCETTGKMHITSIT